MIKKPISLAEIESKLNEGSYSDLSDFIDDFKLMVKNAKKFNRQGSQVWDDAELIEKTVDQFVMSINNTSSGDESGSIAETDSDSDE
jgi:ATP-dependent helicase STH1/SNF2